MADSLWSVGTTEEGPDYSGTHGYDNDFTDMRTIFYAEGPGFKKGHSAPSFVNVEVYGIIARLLGLDPADTDGDISRVEGIFAK